MADRPIFASPITAATGDTRPDGDPVLTDVSGLAKVSVRAAPDTVAAAAMGVTFGSSRRADGVLVAGIRPDEWLLLGEEEAVGAFVGHVDFGGFAHQIDLTHGRLCVRLTGAHAPATLAKVCSLDFGDEMTPNGAAVSASVAKVSCDLVRDDIGGDRSYLVVADRSYGQYLHDALADAAAEFTGR